MMKALILTTLTALAINTLAQDLPTGQQEIDMNDIEILYFYQRLPKKVEEVLINNMRPLSRNTTINQGEEKLNEIGEEHSVDLDEWKNEPPPVEFLVREEGRFQKYSFFTVLDSMSEIERCHSPNVLKQEAYEEFINRTKDKINSIPIGFDELIKILLLPCKGGGYIYYGFWLDKFHGVLEKS